MPLNYSKWDQLELSDDSDIEGHPNVDKRSLIRWKQRDIHEKREQRKIKINHLRAQIDCNNVLLPRIKEIAATLTSPNTSSPQAYFNSLVEQLEKNPSKDCPPGNDPSKPDHTYDGMLLNLLRQVVQETKAKVSDSSLTESVKAERLAKGLADGMNFHVKKLHETIDKDSKELEQEVQEQKKHITSEDLKDGFSNTYIPKKSEPVSVPKKKIEKSKKGKEKATEYEVLNPTASIPASEPAPASKPIKGDETDDEEEMPEMTPGLEGFSKLPIGAFDKSFEYIQNHSDVVVEGASDALLIAAFRAERNGDITYAQKCVHQSLLLQYCEHLGRDGVGIFFKRMTSGNKTAEKVFVDDFVKTYSHLKERVRISKEEELAAGGREQIQLVPENSDQVISFNVPDGPPPENLILEGPGTEGLDVEEVRKALQLRWDVFSSFSDELQEALKDGSLEAVNKVLGDMEVSAAESVVQSLDMAGILNFAEGGIRDETAAGRAAAGLSSNEGEE